jgi:hypothetical protein
MATRRRPRLPSFAGCSRPARARPCLEALEDRTLPAAVTWTGNASTHWSDAGNWSTGHVPGAGDDVVINRPGAVVVYDSSSNAVLHSLQLTAGTLSVGVPGRSAPALTVTELLLAGGTLQGTADLTVSDTFFWLGGSVAGSGQVTVLGNLEINGPSDKVLGATLLNAGQASWTQGHLDVLSGGTFVNEPGATFVAQAADPFDPPFTNDGTFILTPTAGTASFATLTNNGDVLLQSGTLQATSYNQPAGLTALQGGDLAGADPTSLVVIAGGVLAGAGEIDANVLNGNALVLTGTLRIVGNYSQEPDAVLIIPLGGTAQTPQFDQLLIKGRAQLGGVLQLQVAPTFTPNQQGASLPLLVYATHTGKFSTVAASSFPGRVRLSANYSGRGVMIQVQAVPLRQAKPHADRDVQFTANVVQDLQAGLEEAAQAALRAVLIQPALALGSAESLTLLDAGRPLATGASLLALVSVTFSGVAGDPSAARAAAPASAGAEDAGLRGLEQAAGKGLAQTVPELPQPSLPDPGALAAADFAAALVTGALSHDTQVRPPTPEEKRLLNLFIAPAPLAPPPALAAPAAPPEVPGETAAPPAGRLWQRAALAGAALLGWALPMVYRRRLRSRARRLGLKWFGERP